MTQVKAENRQHLVSLVEEHLKKHGYSCDLNHIDVSQITDLSFLFSESTFNGDISQWDVSKVSTFYGTFRRSKFNGDLSKWNVSQADDMTSMFFASAFQGDISGWNVSNVHSVAGLFEKTLYIGDISSWALRPHCLAPASSFGQSKDPNSIGFWVKALNYKKPTTGKMPWLTQDFIEALSNAKQLQQTLELSDFQTAALLLHQHRNAPLLSSHAQELDFNDYA